VFPLAPLSNKPLRDDNLGLLHSFKHATTDSDTIQQWWTRHPRANIGAATGAALTAWVLDIDLHHDGPATLAALVEEHGSLPETVESTTPRGGRHLYWSWPESGGIDCCAGRVGPGLDHRGDGGFIVLPPSARLDGRYRWRRRGIPAEAPAWLLDLARKPRPRASPDPQPLHRNLDSYIAAAVARQLADLAAAREGRRNDQLNRSAFALFGLVKAGALPDEWTRAMLATRAAAIGLSGREIERTIASAAAAAQPRELPPCR
jgi:hypothetical protein